MLDMGFEPQIRKIIQDRTLQCYFSEGDTGNVENYYPVV